MNTDKIGKFFKKLSKRVTLVLVAFVLLYVGDKLQVVTYTELAVSYLQATTVEKTIVTRQDAIAKHATRKVATYAKVKMYVAKPGDTLSKIARTHNIKLSMLVRANKNMTINTKLKVDQMVFIPTNS